MMKISMWSSFLYGRKFETIIPSMHNAGFDSMDLSTEHLDELVASDNAAKRAIEWRDMGLEYNVPLLQTHLPLDSDLSVAGPSRDKQLDYLKRELELVMLMDIPAAVIHARMENNGNEDNIVDALLELCDFLKGSKTSLALENLFRCDTRAKDLISLINLADNHPKLGICLDTGHLNWTGGDPVEFLEDAGTRLTALHIADNTGIGDYHMLPLGRGTVPWRAFMRKLKSMDYKGIFNYEASGENSAEYPEMLDAKLLYSAQLARILLALE